MSPHQRRAADPLGGADADYEHLFLSAWGLEPAQWRPVGSMRVIRQRAAFLWRLDGAASVQDVSLRARRAYDRLAELGTTVSADSTPRGIEIVLPLARVILALRILGDLLVTPDAVLVESPPPAQLRELRRMLAGLRPEVELIIGDTSGSDPIAALRAVVRLSS